MERFDLHLERSFNFPPEQIFRALTQRADQLEKLRVEA